jgi:hypothetical protein
VFVCLIDCSHRLIDAVSVMATEQPSASMDTRTDQIGRFVCLCPSSHCPRTWAVCSSKEFIVCVWPLNRRSRARSHQQRRLSVPFCVCCAFNIIFCDCISYIHFLHSTTDITEQALVMIRLLVLGELNIMLSAPLLRARSIQRRPVQDHQENRYTPRYV